MIKQIKELVIVHFKEVYRNPGIIFWGFFFPILMIWGLGIAFSKQDQLIRTVGWIEGNHSLLEGSTALEREDSYSSITIGNEASGKTTYRLISLDMEEGVTLMKRGVIDLILDESGDSLTYHFDSMNPQAQLAFLHFTNLINGTEAEGLDENQVKSMQTGARYVDFLVPGMLCWSIMMSCMWGISYSLIDKRIKKLMRRMIATPMSKTAFLVSQFIARLILSSFEVALLLAFAYFYFGITIQGDFGGFLLLIFAGNMAFAGLAIFVSSRTSNSQIGNGLINLVVMPMMILSGIFFSYHNFPDWTISFIKVLPLTLLTDNVRGIFNEGLTFASIVAPSLILMAFGLVFFLTGKRIYKWY